MPQRTIVTTLCAILFMQHSILITQHSILIPEICELVPKLGHESLFPTLHITLSIGEST